MKIFNAFLFSCILLLSLLSHSEMKTTLETEGLSFISSDYENTNRNSFGFIGATLLSDKKQPETVMMNLTGLYAVGESTLSYLNLREVYFSYKIDSESNIHLGRKINEWSALDSSWNLGFYQPQFRWNPISPENQGLTGIFWEHNEAFWGLTLLASPINIPDQGPGYELKNGQFQNSNPWFQTPPQNIKFQGQVLPIDYEVNKPETSDIIFQTVYGASLRLGDKDGFFAQISGAYKPSNQLALGYKGVLVTTRVRIDLNPKVYSENLYSADMGYRDTWGSAILSVLYTKPHSPTYDSGFNAPEFSDSMSWGPQINFKLRPFEFSLVYLDTVGGDVKDVGPDASADRASFSQRYLFRQAVQGQVKYTDIFMKKIKLESAFQYRESSKDEFKQINFKNKVYLKGPWAFWADLVLIETADDTSSNMAPYRNLDQVWIGVSYDI